MEEELTEIAKAQLAEKLGLNTEPLKSNLFKGDFGYSIDFSILIPILVLWRISIHGFVPFLIRIAVRNVGKIISNSLRRD